MTNVLKTEAETEKYLIEIQDPDTYLETNLDNGFETLPPAYY